MRYLTRPAIDAAIPANTLIELTNDDPAAAAPDEGVLAAVIEGCEELVDGHLRGRHALPFDTVPSIVHGIALDLVRHALYLRRPEGAVPETVKASYTNAIKLLETIRDGRITIGDQHSGKPTPEPGKIRVRARKQQFAGQVWEHSKALGQVQSVLCDGGYRRMSNGQQLCHSGGSERSTPVPLPCAFEQIIDDTFWPDTVQPPRV